MFIIEVKSKGLGLVGGIVGEINHSSIIADSYNVGEVVCSQGRVGGIAGDCLKGKLYNTYNTGSISGASTNITGAIYGYFQEADESLNVYNNYYLEKLVNGENGHNYVGTLLKSKDEIKSLYSVLGENWKEDKDGKNNGYPILKWQ